MVDTAIFLGAGASKAEGAPLQGELFKAYFADPAFRQSPDVMDGELATFFFEMFGINVHHDDLNAVHFPTFEEVLGIADLGIIRKEGLKNFDIENRAENSGRLRFIAQYLVFLVAKTLDSALQGGPSVHRTLITNLARHHQLKNIVFVSTNYDILIDNALTEHWQSGSLDYGIDFRNFERPGDWERPQFDHRIQLYKPHGSLNWLHCRTCGVMEITPKEKGVVSRLISHFEEAACERCGSVYTPLIVPPSFYKDMSNVFLSTIWNKADIALQSVNHVIFCGYSFPDADIHIKYLLKRAQTNAQRPMRFTVINGHRGKKPPATAEEKSRFVRFLGSQVDYTKLSFEAFAKAPMQVLGPMPAKRATSRSR